MTFRIQGQIYHTISSVLPDKIPKFLQMYFIVNGEIELDFRFDLSSGIDRPILALFRLQVRSIAESVRHGYGCED